MLICTGLWPVFAVLFGPVWAALSTGEATKIGEGHYRVGNQVITAAELGGIYLASMIFGAVIVTGFYALTMFVLFVIWFATKDD